MTGSWLDWLVAGLLVLGGGFGLIGSFGLLRLAQPMQRLHAPSKAATLGLAAVLAATALWLWLEKRQVTGQEVLVILLIFVTAPLATFYLAKLNIARGAARADLPPTGTGSGWATLTPDSTDNRPGA
jgi:multicomponent K+:H+ antiporter subunit G